METGIKCEYCKNEVESVHRCSLYLANDGLMVCQECYKLLLSHLHKPYSKVADNYSQTVYGYYYSRKKRRIQKFMQAI